VVLRYSLCLLTGAYSFVLLSDLPSSTFLVSIFAAACVCHVKTPLRLAGAFLLGVSLQWTVAASTIGDRLSDDLAGRNIELRAVVADFPRRRGSALTFVAETVGCAPLPRQVRLSWYNPEVTPEIGETWLFQVRLRRPRGFANPAGFDYEAWLFRQRVGATGYVVTGKRTDGEAPGWSTRARRHAARRILALLPDDDATAVVLAIGIGARHRITRQQWDLYATTGTSHLMAISGLHIGLAAGGAYLLFWASLSVFARNANVRGIAMWLALCTAAVYAELSGLAVPARRAILMALIMVIGLSLHRRTNGSETVAIVCLLVTLSDPLSIHTPGFQLSFAAVGLLLWLNRSHFRRKEMVAIPGLDVVWSPIRRLAVLQIVLLLGLFPLVAVTFGRVALFAPAVNLLIVPIFNFLTVPATLVGLMLDGPLDAAGKQFLRASHASVTIVLQAIAAVADLPLSRIELSHLSLPMLVAAILIAAAAILPGGWPCRHVGWILLLAVVLHRPQRPPVNCVDLHLLDVGQGLAVVLQTNRHTAVYDAGPAFRSGSDTGQLVVAPFLKSKGIVRIDALIISHGDLDHSGGASSLVRQFEVGQVLAGERMALPGVPENRCHTGQRWRWDGVQFEFLHPKPGHKREGNDASCVLLVSSGERRALLTGDIGKKIEFELVAQSLLPTVDLLSVPHHGSRTSSSAVFVSTVAAKSAVVSSGYRNRWGFPKDDVVFRWESSGTEVLTTAHSGALSQRLCRDVPLADLGRERIERRRYWHE